MTGYRSAAKKSSERRWLSRAAKPLSMLAAWTVISAWDAAGSASSRSTVPATSVNVPRTLVTMRCLAENRTSVWAGSIANVAMGWVPPCHRLGSGVLMYLLPQLYPISLHCQRFVFPVRQGGGSIATVALYEPVSRPLTARDARLAP